MTIEPAQARPIGWYLHHHGSGHRTRFLAIRPHLSGPVVVFSSLAEPATLPSETTWVQLERDDTDDEADTDTHTDDEFDPLAERDPTAGGLLHWAPTGHRGHRDRLGAMVSAVVTHDIRLMVVDVSVEVTILARLLGLSVVVMAQPGLRSDAPHTMAYRMAELIIAPWPAGIRLSPALDAHAATVVHVGGISRFDGRQRRVPPEAGRVLVLAGWGGFDLAGSGLVAASASRPDLTWRWLGVAARTPSDHDRAGSANPALPSGAWSEDPWDELCAAEIVISAAGQNAVADIAASGSSAVFLAQARPFDEQRRMAQELASAGLATAAPAADAGAGPESDGDWTRILEIARAARPDWSRWQIVGAAARAAASIGHMNARANRSSASA